MFFSLNYIRYCATVTLIYRFTPLATLQGLIAVIFSDYENSISLESALASRGYGLVGWTTVAGTTAAHSRSEWQLTAPNAPVRETAPAYGRAWCIAGGAGGSGAGRARGSPAWLRGGADLSPHSARNPETRGAFKLTFALKIWVPFFSIIFVSCEKPFLFRQKNKWASYFCACLSSHLSSL